MKKLLTVCLAAVMMMGLTACGAKEEKKTTEEVKESVVVADSAVEILEKVWAAHGDDQKFACAGGDYNNSVMDAPGAFDVADTESLDAMLGVPKDVAGDIDDAASLMHMMNANTFTGGVYHLTDSSKQQSFADALKTNIMNRQWMCGFPDTLIIVSVGDEYVLSAFGAADIIDTFKTKLLEEYDMAQVMYEESLAQ